MPSNKPHAAAVRAATDIGSPSVLARRRHAAVITREYAPLVEAATDVLFGAISDGHGQMYYPGKLHEPLRQALRAVVGEEARRG